MRTTTTTAAVSAATAGVAAAALVLLTRRRRSAPTIRTIRRTPTAVLGEYQAPTHLWARAGDDQPDPDRCTRAAINVPVEVDDPDQLWRQLCVAEYAVHVRECGNDGRPEDDLPTSEQQAAAAHIAGRLSELVGIPTGTLHARAADAAFAHGQDPGTDDDPDRYAPDWAHARASYWPGW